MKKINMPLLALFATFFLAGLNQVYGDAVVKPNSTQKLMQQFLKELSALKSFMVSEEKFNDKKNAPEISRHLKNFANLTKASGHDKKLQGEAFRFSRQVLEDHVKNSERVFRLGSKAFARWQLATTTSICLSCHSQVPAYDQAFGEFLDEKIFSSPSDKAEFLFATKSFQKAAKLNDEIIQGFPQNKVNTDQVENALERQVAFYTRIERDLPGAQRKFSEYLKKQELPPAYKKNLEVWVSQLKQLEKEPLISGKTSNVEALLKFARKNLNPEATAQSVDANNPFLVGNLYASGILYEYLQTHPVGPETPEVLYWLAIADRSINNNFFYSLADLYLRECILNFSASPMAKKCFKEYEEEMIFGYTGSSGQHLPEEVRKELQQMKDLTEGKTKVELNKQ